MIGHVPEAGSEKWMIKFIWVFDITNAMYRSHFKVETYVVIKSQ